MAESGDAVEAGLSFLDALVPGTKDRAKEAGIEDQKSAEAALDKIVPGGSGLVKIVLGSAAITNMFKEVDIVAELDTITKELTRIREEMEHLKESERTELAVLDLESAIKRVEFCNLEINQVIEKLDVKEEVVEKLLLQTDKLSDLTLNTDVYLIYLEEKLSNFTTLIDRMLNYKVTMTDYLTQRRLAEYISSLQDLGFTELTQLHCKDADEYNTKILSKLEKKHDHISVRNKRELKRICIHPQVSWQQFEDKKAKLSKQSLLDMSPLLVEGFDVISRKAESVMPHTQKAIALLKHMDDYKSDDDDDTYDCTLFLDDIKYDKSNVHQRKAMDLIETTSSCCTIIFEEERKIRRSVLVSRSIIYYQPSLPSNDKAKDLWDSLNTNVILIKDCFVSTVEVSVNYFGYFSLLKEEFRKVKDTNASFKEILKLVQEFNNIKKSFTQQNKKLDELAKQCIADGIQKGITLGQFENYRRNRDDANQKYKEKLKKSQEISQRFDAEYDRLMMEGIDFMAHKFTNGCLLNKYRLADYTDRSDCPGHHGLAKLDTGTMYFRCDGCNRTMDSHSTMYGCRQCNYNLCVNCYG